MTVPPPPLAMTRVTFAYRRGEPILEGLDLDLEPGVTLLLGPNGAGKSTLLKVAAGVERPQTGSVSVGGRDLWRDEVAARRSLAYVPEQPDLSPYASIRDVLRLVCRLRGEELTEADRWLERLELAGLRRASVRELSKGQKRRVLYAAARIGSARVLLLDEPLDAFDQGLRSEVVEWIALVRQRGGAALVSTHELEPFADADRVLAARGGAIERVTDLPTAPEARLARLRAIAGGAPLAGS